MPSRIPTDIGSKLREIASHLAAVEAAESQPGLPAGSAAGGSDFEHAMADAWVEIGKTLEQEGCSVIDAISGKNRMCGLRSPNGERVVYLLGSCVQYGLPPKEREQIPELWGQHSYTTSHLIEAHLGDDVLKFAPETSRDSERFFSENYPLMYAGRKTSFDFTLACADNKTLSEKILFEYKSGKSSSGVSLDGNAHERLSFQMLQYLEIAGHGYPVSFNVFTSSAFSKYKNKYHVSFNQQSERLGNVFQYFQMRICTNETEYLRFFSMLFAWLYQAQPLRRDYRSSPI